MGHIKDMIDRLLDGIAEILTPEPDLVPIPVRPTRGRPSRGQQSSGDRS